MADEKRRPDSSFGDFDARLRRARESDQTQRPGAADEPRRLNWGAGVQIGIELFAGILGGVILGYVLDHWLGTRPVFIIICFLLGAAAGMSNAFRYMRRMQRDDAP